MRLAWWLGWFGAVLGLTAAVWVFAHALVGTSRFETAVLSSAPSVIGWVFFGAGAWLIGTGWLRRVGRSLHCARCGFEFEVETRKLIEFCPECRASWRWYGGTRRGRPVQRTSLVVVGAVLWALLFAAVCWREALWRAGLKQLSTPALTRLVVTADSQDADRAFAILTERTLSARDQTTLATGLLDRRAADGYLPQDLSRWVQIFILVNPAGLSLQDRYYGDLVHIRLRAPDRLNIGQVDEIVATAEFVGESRGPFPEPIAVYVAGVGIDDEEVPDMRGTRGITATPGEPTLPLAVTPLRFMTAGEHSVRLDCWLMVSTTDPRAAVTWNSDGSPNLGTTPLWSKHVVIERMVEVAPVAPAR